MGINGINSSSFDSSPVSKKKVNNARYSIKKMHKKDDFLILKINYLDCANYEGNKILVFRGCSIVDLVQQKSIDPHFSDNKEFISPIARFKPDDEGWKMAEFFVENFK